ncbi:hypothetical protein J6590_034210 [Homalodisca vitripennis]|nr:hypothetical protein J6590_034210 [Homalodisca vitripennis]
MGNKYRGRGHTDQIRIPLTFLKNITSLLIYCYCTEYSVKVRISLSPDLLLRWYRVNKLLCRVPAVLRGLLRYGPFYWLNVATQVLDTDLLKISSTIQSTVNWFRPRLRHKCWIQMYKIGATIKSTGLDRDVLKIGATVQSTVNWFIPRLRHKCWIQMYKIGATIKCTEDRCYSTVCTLLGLDRGGDTSLRYRCTVDQCYNTILNRGPRRRRPTKSSLRDIRASLDRVFTGIMVWKLKSMCHSSPARAGATAHLHTAPGPSPGPPACLFSLAGEPLTYTTDGYGISREPLTYIPDGYGISREPLTYIPDGYGISREPLTYMFDGYGISREPLTYIRYYLIWLERYKTTKTPTYDQNWGEEKTVKFGRLIERFLLLYRLVWNCPAKRTVLLISEIRIDIVSAFGSTRFLYQSNRDTRSDIRTGVRANSWNLIPEKIEKGGDEGVQTNSATFRHERHLDYKRTLTGLPSRNLPVSPNSCTNVHDFHPDLTIYGAHNVSVSRTTSFIQNCECPLQLPGRPFRVQDSRRICVIPLDTYRLFRHLNNANKSVIMVSAGTVRVGKAHGVARPRDRFGARDCTGRPVRVGRVFT